ncbi:adenylate/guanylate cyclase domain-containing protein [Methylocystis sp. SB2]|uniref:adenylate/guanylate cyclase domain-containing protein n=2 Tax=Methylocystis sp. (strain SB2) TaxID=743836 RepID=UPI00041E2FC8|nr:adenylate/guanylate cyclase domain-containing protein [Methylocystis sp. SB2]
MSQRFAVRAFSLSIRRKIMGIALALIVLMVLTSLLSMIMVRRTGEHFAQLSSNYMPAYGNLARANIRSLERALTLRRMVIARTVSSNDGGKYDALKKVLEEKGAAVESEIRSARALIGGLIQDRSTFGDESALVRIDSRLDSLLRESRRHLNEEIDRLLKALEANDARAVSENLVRVDEFRDDVNRSLDAVRSDMLALLQADSAVTVDMQRQVMVVAAALTLFAAALGVVFAMLVSNGVTIPVRRLLEGTRAVEAGQLDEVIAVTTFDEIGHLTAAFNRMVEQLRLKKRILDTFGRYIDPRVVKGLIDAPTLAAEGQRRVMTVLFCDVAGFTTTSERMTPQGLVKILNQYFSTMSAPVREHEGIIDKYIGDAIMAYWGPPFNEDSEQTRLAALAAIDMLNRLERLRDSFPEIIGMRNAPISFDLRIGVATGEALVGSIGSEHMMNYTVIGDTANLAARLEGANKIYGSRILASEATAMGAADVVETREIDLVAMAGQARPERIYEIMARKGCLTSEQEELRARFLEGLEAYRQRSWDAARRAFLQALAIAPEDGPSLTFIRRIDALIAAPPENDWDGSWRLEQK